MGDFFANLKKEILKKKNKSSEPICTCFHEKNGIFYNQESPGW